MTPDEGYALGALTVTDASGSPVAVTKISDTQYTFIMPRSRVTVSASFTDHDCPSAAYSDLSTSAWYHTAVDYALNHGMMSGVGEGRFDPDGSLSRAMLVQILWAMEGRPDAAEATAYTDVFPGAWYHSAVQWAAEQGVVSGYGDGSYGPERRITREELAVILYGYARSKGYDLSAAGSLSGFADRGSLSGWAEQAMTWAVGEGLISGKDGGVLDPAGSATRAEAAVILMNFCENIAEQS